MKTKRNTIIDSNRWLKPKRSTIVDKCLLNLLSNLPPTKFSIQPYILLQKHLWRNNIHIGAPATTKSWLPTTTRCCGRAHQRPQLRHVSIAITSPSKYNNPYQQSGVPWYSLRNKYCTIPDPFDPMSKLMEIGRVVESRGRFYSTSLQGAVVEMDGVRDTRDCLEVTAVGPTRAVPSVACRFFKEYVVEMEGEVLLVFLIHEKTLEVVDDVEVFRVDSNKLRLMRVERMRGKTMFLKENEGGVWVDSAEFGCRDDCVFFTQGNNEESWSWMVYDIKNCCISSVLLDN